MPAPNSLTEAFDNLYTTTWQELKDEVADSIFAATPFWYWLKEHGGIKTQAGGRFIAVPIRYAKSDKTTFITKGGTVSLSDLEFLTEAKYDWKYMVDSIVRFGVDDQQNRGKYAIKNLAEAKLSNSKDSLVDLLETTLFGANSADSTKFHGLRDLVQDDPTAASTIAGGIQQNTQAFWRNQTDNMTGLSFAVHGVNHMRTLYNNCSNNLKMDKPDIIVGGQTPYESYEDATLEQKRIVNQKLGDAGFENVQFKGIPFVWAPACANTRIYFLNTKFINFFYDPMMNFEMTEWKPIPDQVNDRAAQIVLAGNLITNRRRCHGVMHTIDTL